VTGYVLYRVFALVDAPCARSRALLRDAHPRARGAQRLCCSIFRRKKFTIIARPIKTLVREDPESRAGDQGDQAPCATCLRRCSRRAQVQPPVVVRMSGVGPRNRIHHPEDLTTSGCAEGRGLLSSSYNFSGELYIVPRDNARRGDLRGRR
jgi:hypothetical protein